MRADVEAGDEETSAEWLQELAGGQIPGELPVESEPTDWLDRLSPNETEEPAEENKPETPADEGEPPSQADEVSDWLKKLHDQEPEEPAQPESEIPAQPVEPIEATPDLSAWLSSLDGETPQVCHDPAPAQFFSYCPSGAGAAEEVGDEVAFVGRGFDDTFQQGLWFLGWVTQVFI